MKFDWVAPLPQEYTCVPPPPAWLYVALFLLVEGAALSMIIPDWPAGKSVLSVEFFQLAVAAPTFFWIALCCTAYVFLYETDAFQAAFMNAERWNVRTAWQGKLLAGIAVIDCNMLLPEPDLAERMLGLEGSPPDNPGKVMRLESIVGTDRAARELALIETLLTPLLPGLSRMMRGNSLDIVIQCDQAASSMLVQRVWGQLQLPGQPVIRWLPADQVPNFAEPWFDADKQSPFVHDDSSRRSPNYRLLLAWHLGESPESEGASEFSEAAVALLLQLRESVQDSVKYQAWLPRQMMCDADQVERSLKLLIAAGQAPRERLRHFWYGPLKGLPKHATLGAIDSLELKSQIHALESAIGPQAPMAHWILQGLAAKMAYYGQGPQLVAQVTPDGVALNIVLKEKPAVNNPWKAEYEYDLIPRYDLVRAISLCIFIMLLPKIHSVAYFELLWGMFFVLIFLVSLGWRLFVSPRMLRERVYFDSAR